MPVARLDPLTGCGLLTLPRPHEDVLNLHESDRSAMLRKLGSIAWTPSEDEDGCMSHEGYTHDGRELVGLYGECAVIDCPSVDEMADAYAALVAEARRL